MNEEILAIFLLVGTLSAIAVLVGITTFLVKLIV
jgi:hypothetical protein